MSHENGGLVVDLLEQLLTNPSGADLNRRSLAPKGVSSRDGANKWLLVDQLVRPHSCARIGRLKMPWLPSVLSQARLEACGLRFW